VPLFRKREPLAPDAPLPDHLEAIAAGRDGAVEAYVRALAARTLWVGLAQLPAGLQPGDSVELTADVEVALLGSTLPDGTGRSLLAFTEEAGVQARAPRALPVGLVGRDVLDLVVRSYDGVVVDAHARWQALASDWVGDALS